MESRKIERRLLTWQRSQAKRHSEDGISVKGFTAFDIPLGWHDARAFCRKKGMDLATIKSEHENDDALLAAKKACQHIPSRASGWDLCAWHGLNDFAEEGQQVWSSGLESNYRNFLEGEPNNMNEEDGMALCWSFQGKWIDYSNDGELPCLLCSH